MNWRCARTDPPESDNVQFVLDHSGTPMTAVYRHGSWFRRKYGAYMTRVDGIKWWCAPTAPPASFLDGVAVDSTYTAQLQRVLAAASENKG